jgi:hypothetical protein
VLGAWVGGGKAGATPRGVPELRQQYTKEVRELEGLGLSARAAGQNPETTARMLCSERNALKDKYREQSPPDAVKIFEQRNIQKYGDAIGPTVEQLNAQGKSWEQIIDSAARPGGSDLGF